MARRRAPERKLFFTWETRRSRIAVFSRRGMRIALTVLMAGWLLWVLVGVERRHRATFVTRTTIARVMQAVEAFRADHDGRCPTTLAELVSPGGRRDPYLARFPSDGWGRPFRYQCPGRKYPRSVDLTSAGPSGTFEGSDQIE